MEKSKPIRLTGNFVEATTEQTHHCEECNVRFPVEEERFGMCRQCNLDSGFCYECEKKDELISELKSSNEEMLEMLKELQDVFKMKDSLTQGPGTSMGTIINDKLDNLITKAEGK